MSIFNLVVDVIDTQATVAGEISPGPAKGNPDTTGAGSWEAARDFETYFGAIACGARSASIQYSDGLTYATGTITFSGDPANNDTVTIAGVVTTFVTATPAGAQVQRGVSQAATMANLVAFINRGGNANGLAGFVTAVLTSSTIVTINAAYPGTIGNLITMSKSCANISAITSPLASGAVASTAQFPIKVSCGR